MCIRDRHYRLDQIQPRHFEETADLSKVPRNILRQAFKDLVENGLPSIEAVASALPAGFPDRVAAPIINYAKSRITLLKGQFEAGLIGRA